MKVLLALAASLLAFPAIASAQDPPPPGHKVTICHNGHSITVDESSWTAKAHIKHGDRLGECKPDGKAAEGAVSVAVP